MSVHSPSAHNQPGAAKTVADVLAAAADLIEPSGRWTQFNGAVTPEGWGTTANDPRAVAWDIIGAIHKVSHDDDLIDRTKNFLLAHIGNLATYNDAPRRTQAEVVTTLRQIAERARTGPQTDSVGTSACASAPTTPGEGEGL